MAPAELEDILLAHPKIRDVTIVGVPCKISGEVPKAFVVREDSDLSEDEVKDFVKSKIFSLNKTKLYNIFRTN